MTAFGAGERNFHVFHMLTDPKVMVDSLIPLLKNQLPGSYDSVWTTLTDASKQRAFRYLLPAAAASAPSAPILDSGELPSTFSELTAALQSFGVTAELQRSFVFPLLTAILSLGNVVFRQFVPGVASASAASASYDTVEVAPESLGWLTVVATLLGVQPAALRRLFTERQFASPRGSVAVRPLDVQSATSTRDSFARALYGALFQWLVTQMNTSLGTPAPIPAPVSESVDFSMSLDAPSRQRTGVSTASSSTLKSALSSVAEDKKPQPLSISILDLFGFECFPVNGLEQLLINYANVCDHQIFFFGTLSYLTHGFSLSPRSVFIPISILHSSPQRSHSQHQHNLCHSLTFSRIN